jgi:cytochrome P450
MAEHGLNFPDKPVGTRLWVRCVADTRHQDDMLQWFMDASFTHPERFSNRELAIRVLVLNFASIHTTANSLTHALYHLAVNPACCEIIRSEVQAVIQSSGWTKAAVSKMHRLDSFLKESTRFSTLNGCELKIGPFYP